MSLTATVKFNENAEPYRVEVGERSGHAVSFAIRGSSAIATSVEPPAGEGKVYVDEVTRCMEYVEQLPFVQAVSLDEFEPLEEE